MTTYSWHMTDPKQATNELVDALDAIGMRPKASVSLEAVEFADIKLPAGVEILFTPAMAIELAMWLKERTQARPHGPYQGQFSFTTE